MEYPQKLVEDVNKRARGLNLEGLNPGAGPVPCKIMLVGEAPGRDELVNHKPFSGASGKELMKSLAEIGLYRQQVYISSVVRSRPFAVKKVYSKRDKKIVTKYPNRKPNKKELLAHAALIDYEIEKVKPKILILLGATASSRMLGEERPMTELHGHAFAKQKILKLNQQHDGYCWSEKYYLVLVEYHPAAIFYNRKLAADIKADWLNIKNYLSYDA